MGERRRRRAELVGERAESSAALEVRGDAVIRRQIPVERIGERSTLYRTDAEHAGTPVLAGNDDLAGAARPGEVFELAR